MKGSAKQAWKPLAGLVLLSFAVACDREPTAPPGGPGRPNPDLIVSSSSWNLGDVFAGVSGGIYNVYNNAGTFKENINLGTGGFTTGCSFNPARDKLYTTGFDGGQVVVFDNADPHPIIQTIATGIPGVESIVFDAAGNFFVGHAGGNQDVQKYDAAGNLLATYDVAVGPVGSDWIELASDQTTLFYTSEGGLIRRFDTGGNTQLADFADIGGRAFALRLLPPGDGSGGLLVAHSADVERLDATGTVVQAYQATGEGSWFALNLDPNGTSFWSGNIGTGNFYRFNIATGTIEVGPIFSGTSNGLFGLCVKGEITGGGGGSNVQIDIKPGSDPNSIKLKGGNDAQIAVAILTTTTFDAATVDPSTVTLGDGSAPDTPVAVRQNGTLMASLVDVDGDGDLDLVLHFSRDALIANGDLTGATTKLILKGRTTGGTSFTGEDSVRPIP